MEWKSKVQGKIVHLTREKVIEAVRGLQPGRVQRHAVEIEGVWYPTKQAFARVVGIHRLEARTLQATVAFRKLGFRCEARSGPDPDLEGRPPLRPPPWMLEYMTGEKDVLEIRPILLEWGWWKWWDQLGEESRAGEGIVIPTCAGVYEIAIYGCEDRLYIGRTSNLRTRIREAIGGSSTTHPAAVRLAQNEDLSKVVVRWADTERPATAEEELHQRHVERFGALPKYTERT